MHQESSLAQRIIDPHSITQSSMEKGECRSLSVEWSHIPSCSGLFFKISRNSEVNIHYIEEHNQCPEINIFTT